MLTLAAPAWLLGLALLPLLRLLHRRGDARADVLVSCLSLWRGATAASPAGRERRPPDPAWRRRALLCGLLFVALAGPQVPVRRPSVTLWIDDSLSMLTRESGDTRLAQGLAQANALLETLPGADVAIRTLGRPWRDLGERAQGAAATVAAEAGSTHPAPPPRELLRRDSLHWLVTDGAHPALVAWDGSTHPDRVIQVGAVDRNVGVQRASARRSLTDPGRVDLLVEIANGGNAAETREVTFAADATMVAQSKVVLAAGASAALRASIAWTPSVVVTLQPGDALTQDDTLVLDLSDLRKRSVAVDPACGRTLAEALATHPAVQVARADAAAVDAAFDCSARSGNLPVPTARVRTERIAAVARGAPRWSSSLPPSRRVALDAEGLPLAADVEPRPGDQTLLAIGDRPVIVSRSGPPRRVETSLDLGSPELAQRAEVPLLVNLMLEELLGERLLDATVVVDRGAGSTRVIPASLSGADASAGRAPVPQVRDASSPVVLAALLVLVWELLALHRQWSRRGARVQAGAS